MQRAVRLQYHPVQDAAAAGAPTLPRFLRRAILATDGTVSNLLEEFLGPVVVEKLDEHELPAGAGEAWVGLEPGLKVISREVLIRTRESARVLLHAESLLILDYLDDILRRELLETDKPIGKLIGEYHRETYRELLGHRREAAGQLATHFDCTPEQTLIARLYRIHLGGRPAIQITERFRDDGEVSVMAVTPEESR